MRIKYEGEIFEFKERSGGSTVVSRVDSQTGVTIEVECPAVFSLPVEENMVSLLSDIYISHMARNNQSFSE